MTSEKTTRRGFLQRTAIVTAGGAVAACGHSEPRREEALHPDSVDTPGAEAQGVVQLSTTVNGQPSAHAVDGDLSALDLLRDELELTGCKRSCGHGACGACTVTVDGRPVASCLLPATALHNRQVMTVEGIAKDGALHPIQRAFIGEDAMQCGFCTPGFVVEAVAFHDRWRQERGRQAPTREDIAAALSGHLCRCGAYESIYRAVAAACAGKYDVGEPTGPRYDAREKVTGAARYTVDIKRPNMAHARFLRSPYASARVRRIDWTRALELPGVLGVIEVLDASRKVRFVGQEVAAVAATSERAAEAALAAIEVDWEPLPPVIELDAALAEGAPLVYTRKQSKKTANNSSEGPLLPTRWRGNLRGPLRLLSRKRGAADRDTRPADDVVSGRYETHTQAHTCLEPHGCVAEWKHGQLWVWISTQAVRHIAEDLAEHFGLPREKVEVHADYIGGGFGSKATLKAEAIAAVQLADLVKRPVRLILDRREELTVGGLRPAVRTDISAGLGKKGGLALKVSAYGDGGAAVGSTTTIFARIMYPQAELDLEDYDVLTNKPPGCPFRGPGGPPAYFAIEQSVDELAHKLGEDPIALRQRWNKNDARARVYDWAAALPAWRERPPPQPDRGRYRRGVGAAASSWFYFAMPSSRVQIFAGRDGVIVSTACQDMGNGTRTVLASVVSEALGLARNQIDVRIGSSRAVPGPMSGGSRTTCTIGPAAADAVEQLKHELVDVARMRMGMPGGAMTRDGTGVSQGGRTLSWAEILPHSPEISVIGKRGRDKGGFFLPPIEGIAPGKYLSGAVQVTEIEVDTRLGRVRPINTWIALSVGRIYNPILARSQVEGGVIQGASYALYEERRVDPRHGYLLTGGLEDYRIAGISDVGDIHVEFMPGGFENARGRGVGLGELCTLPALASISNAVWHATGWRPRALPLTPDRVLSGLRDTTGPMGQTGATR
ncbi:MAG: molybdopterin-dependent oxidoreductase [Myxococcales bacterium]|nr:molybdopterin-dependent oxidoreductase [Myxococcales bacterium]